MGRRAPNSTGTSRWPRHEPVGGRPVGAFFEAHIEQGPILEREKKTIGVVTGAQGQRWYEITGPAWKATPAPRRWKAAAMRWSARPS